MYRYDFSDTGNHVELRTRRAKTLAQQEFTRFSYACALLSCMLTLSLHILESHGQSIQFFLAPGYLALSSHLVW
jgi:hypothetical protein